MIRFVVGCEMEEFKPYYEKCGVVEQPGIAGGELTPDWVQRFRENPEMVIVWRLDGKIVGHAIWHESSTEEHREGDARDKEDREILEKLLGGKKEFVGLHEVWLKEEYRRKGYGERFFEFLRGL